MIADVIIQYLEMGNGILVIGSANVDLVVKLDKIPNPGETIGDGQFHQFCGGKGANQAVAAARSGQNVVFVGLVGDDAYGDAVIENLKAASIDTQYLHKEKEAHTGIALISVSSSGENAISIAPGANKKLGIKRIDQLESVIASASLALLQLEIPFETCVRVIELAGQHGTRVMLNPAPSDRRATELIGSTDLLVVNEHEAYDISGLPTESDAEIALAAEWLFDRGAKHVIVTLGSRGVFLKDEIRSEFLPTFEVEAVDTTGAGDAFCGTLACEFSRTDSIEEGIKYALAASAISVTRLGAQEALPTRKEVHAFLAEYSR